MRFVQLSLTFFLSELKFILLVGNYFLTFERNMLIIVVFDVFQVARHPDAVTVVTGIVGCAGLKVRLRF